MEDRTVSSRIEERKNLFQKSVDPSEIKHRRESFAIELRKQKRIQGINKRRFLVTGHQAFNDIGQDSLQRLSFESLDPVIITVKPELALPDYTESEKLKMICEMLVQETNLEVISKLVDYIWSITFQCHDLVPTYIDLGFIPPVLKYLDLSYPEEIVVIFILGKSMFLCH
jgi:hypothetical protein